MPGNQSAEPRQHALWELVQTAHLAERRFGEIFARFGLTPAQYGVMASLADGDDLSQAELARAVLVRPQSLSSVIETLINGGLVIREGEPGRGWRKTLRLSERGRMVFDAARPSAYQLLSPDVIGLDTRETAQLATLMRTVREHLSKPSRTAASPERGQRS